MGDFEVDTRVQREEGAEGRYSILLNDDWRIWGPSGGYLAAVALRAAGEEARIKRPVTFSCHYLSVASFDEPLGIDVVVLRPGKRAESLRVSMSQSGKRVLEAMVWSAVERPGLEHQAIVAPPVPPPEKLPNISELRAERGMDEEKPRYPFWTNFEEKPLDWDPRDPPEPREPRLATWIRYRPRPRLENPFVDAARSVMLIDTMIWPAAWRHHVPEGYYAPSLDASIWFHAQAPDEEWLLCDIESHVGRDGFIAGTGRVWDRHGQLLASGGAQLACVSSKLYSE